MLYLIITHIVHINVIKVMDMIINSFINYDYCSPFLNGKLIIEIYNHCSFIDKSDCYILILLNDHIV